MNPQTPQQSPQRTCGVLNNFPRRRLHRHKDDRRVPGHRPDEERSALSVFFEGPVLHNTERVQPGGLQSIRCGERMDRSDPLGFWEWN